MNKRHWGLLLAALLLSACATVREPTTVGACELANCRIEPLRRIDDIVIESSALNALPGNETST